jgi:Transcriptional regulator, AbiEi antitoxin
MTKPIPAPTTALLSDQQGTIARSQAASSGIDAMTIRNRLRYGRWQRLQRGVYAAFSGQPGRESELWAALLRAGPGATLSHQTAAEQHRLIKEPRPDEPSLLIHITVPGGRRPAQLSRIPGVVIHRSMAIDRTRHPVMSPPCTRVEDTVLDLIEAADTFAAAYDWICRAIGRRRTTAERIRAAMDQRKKMRWRKSLELALADAGDGALSLLEYRYVRYVERPHGLPAAKRQERVRQRTGNRYLDNLYEDYRVCVELDGTAAHPADEQWQDKRRDNWNLVHGNILTLRFGFLDLTEPFRCTTAQDVATRLTLSGWPGRPHPCPRPACPLGSPHDHG